MAIMATILGSVIGFISFLTALLAFDASFLSACLTYLTSGFATIACAIAFAMLPARKPESEAQNAVSA